MDEWQLILSGVFQSLIFTLTSYSLVMKHRKRDIYNMQWKNKVSQCHYSWSSFETVGLIEINDQYLQVTHCILIPNEKKCTSTLSKKWLLQVHGTAAESFWIWVEDPENNHIYHSEYFLLHKKQVSMKQKRPFQEVSIAMLDV